MPGACYAELHCHSYFSLLDGASSPEVLVDRAAALGYPALALTDHNNLSGAVRFWRAARDRGIRPILGAEVTLVGDTPPDLTALKGQRPQTSHLTLLAETQRGYANLCRLISAGQLAGQKAHPHLTMEEVAKHAQGLICLSGCRHGAIPAALLAGQEAEARQAASQLLEIFPHRFWIEVQQHALPTDARLTALLRTLAQELGIGIVATNNIHYAERSGQRLHDVLTCIRQRTTLPEALAGGLLRPNSEMFLKPLLEIEALFQGLPHALHNTLRLAERCNASLDFSAHRLPDFALPQGHTAESYLRYLCQAGLQPKFGVSSKFTKQAEAQLAHELGVIRRVGLAGYFLVVWDIVRFARDQGIRCQGRGSAANSLVAYLLGITPVDPLRHNLLFERFLSEGTTTMPDIDIDFAADRREEVIQYIYERYGEEHVGMVCNVVTYRARSAVREVAKALAFPHDAIDRVAKALDTRSAARAAEELPLPELASEPAGSTDSLTPTLPWHILADLLRQMDGIPRHLSIHVGGMLITAAPLVEVVPLERATMPGRVVVQWDKDSVEDAGLIKIDLLSLRTLGAVEEALAHVREHSGSALDLEHLPLDDPAVFHLLQRADTVGCFQVESRAQAQMLPKLQPQRFEDIVVGVALIRPGPIQGGMVHPYLRRRQGLEPASYPHPALEPVLNETMGVIVFQEQVIRVAMVIAGFTATEADQLRRAMSRSRSREAMAALRGRFLRGAQANGVDEATAEEVFRQLEGFAGFGFCKSHAAAFALVAYQTLYLKAHFPASYFCALLNHQPMGFYPPEVIIGDARRHGVPILHPDVNHSAEACTLEEAAASLTGHSALALRLGLRYVHGLGEAWQVRIVERRDSKPFQNLPDFCRRTRLPRPIVENLIRAGAMESLAHKRSNPRRNLLWELGGIFYQEEGLDIEMPMESVALPVLGEAERMGWEYELLGLAPGGHVMDLYRPALQRQGVSTSRDLEALRDGAMVRLAGYAVVRQRPPTAKGFLFITLEDEEGLANLIVRPQVYEQYRDALRNAALLWIEGQLQREGHAFSVLVHRAAALGPPR